MYKILESLSLINEAQLNKFYKDGWELVQIVAHNDMFYFYFKLMAGF